MRQTSLSPVFAVEDGVPIMVCSPRVVIGRGAHCHVTVEGEAVSVNHAEVVFTDNGFLLRDLRSTNGIYIGGKRVKRARLKEGDRFRLGRDGPCIAFSLEPAPQNYTMRAIEDERLLLKILWPTIAAVLLLGLGLLASRGISSWQQSRATKGLFLLALERSGKLVPVGTGFAVSAGGWLGTNAHVAAKLEEGDGLGVAIPNDRPALRLRVKGVILHPGYLPGEYLCDVALVEIEQSFSIPALRLDDRMPTQGERILCLGYPSRALNLLEPRASLLRGTVNRTEGNLFFQHDLGVYRGLSGSPILDDGFRCIGLVLGGDMKPFSEGGTEGRVGWAIQASVLSDLLETQRALTDL